MDKIKPVAAILTLLVCFGCTQSGGPDVATVHGVVTLDNQPLANALVTFQPQDGRPSYGRTDAQGEYTLVYTDGVEGAVLGTHEVSISTRDEGNPDEGIKPSEETVPAKYNTRTELTATVKAGDNECNFDLSSKGEIEVLSDAAVTETPE